MLSQNAKNLRDKAVEILVNVRKKKVAYRITYEIDGKYLAELEKAIREIDKEKRK